MEILNSGGVIGVEVSNTSFSFFDERVAFYCLLKAFGIGRGDKVLLPAHTSSFIPQTVCYSFASPTFADIDPSNYNSLLKHYIQAYEEASENKEKGTLSAVLIHHTYGNPNPETEKIVNWAKEKGLFAFEYCEYAPQLDSTGRALGTYGDGGFFSFGSQGIANVTNPSYLGIMKAMEKVAPKPTKIAVLILLISCSIRFLEKKYRSFRQVVRFLARAKDFWGSGSNHEPIPRDFFKGVCSIQHRLSKYDAKQFDVVSAHREQLASYYSELLRKRGLPVYAFGEGAILSGYPVKVTYGQECLEAAASIGFELCQGLDYPALQYSEANNQWNDTQESSASAAKTDMVCLPLHSQVTRAYAEELIEFLACYMKGIDYHPFNKPKYINPLMISRVVIEIVDEKASNFLRKIRLNYKIAISGKKSQS